MFHTEDRVTIDAHNAHVTSHVMGHNAGAIFRIVARINSYHEQSSIILSRWDGTQWQEVTSLRGNGVTTWKAANSARIRKTFTTAHIYDDITALMTEARFITNDFK